MTESQESSADEESVRQSRSAEFLRARLVQELRPNPSIPTEPPSIPDHQLLRRIGSGAYGDVWLARNALGTLRAVKIVYRSRFKEARPYEREFGGILKYEPISRTHEGLVQILHVGRNDSAGCFYYVMELADQWPSRDAEVVYVHSEDKSQPTLSPHELLAYHPRTLRSELESRHRLSPTQAAQLGLHLAKALEHHHGRGLVHRDIKPSNIIFVAGKLKLADIGLVTEMGSSQSFVGTEGYIPPEGPGTPSGDIYALGKLLYELLTGHDRLEFPQLPPRIQQLPEGEALLELNEVMTRACAPNPLHRYAKATELQADLNLFLAGRSLRRARNFERILARSKQLVAFASILLALMGVALWISMREERHAQEAARLAMERAQDAAQSRAQERSLRLRAEAAEQAIQQQLYTALLEQARATVRSRELGQRVHALDAISRAAALSNSVELRREAMAALALPDLRFERTLTWGQDFMVRWMDPTFERIALCRGRGPVEIRTSDGRQIATLPASTNLACYQARWSRDGRFLAAKRDYPGGGHQADLEVWEMNDYRRILLLHHVGFDARSFHPLKPQILVSDQNGRLTAWDLNESKVVNEIALEIIPENLAYSPDGQFVAVSYRHAEGWAASIYEATHLTRIVVQTFSNFLSTLDWHPNGQQIAVTDYGGNVQLMDARTGKLHLLGRHKAEAATAVFHPQGDYLFTGGWERELICWNVRTMRRSFTVGLDSYVLQFRADGKACALTTLTGLQWHWFEHPTVQQELSPEMGPRLWHAVFSPNGRWLAASSDRQVGVWDLAGRASGTIVTEGFGTQLFWSSDGQELFGSSRNDNGLRWRIQPSPHNFEPPLMQRLSLPRPDGFTSLSLVSNSIAWTTDKGSRVTGLNSMNEAGPPWTKTAQGINRISPDMRWLAIYEAYGSVLNIYQIPGLELVGRLTNQANIAGINFSPLGDELAAGSRGQVEFWSTTSWQRTRRAIDFLGSLHLGLLYEPDGRSIWLLKNYQSAGLYRSQSFEPLLRLPVGIIPLARSSDGRFLATSHDAQLLQVWDLQALRQQFRDLGLDWQDL